MARHHDIDCLVDTIPMAEKINKVSHEVQGTTTAVVAMKTAVLAAEKAGTEHVCRNVNRGFFTLMHSQLSQKIAAKKSRTEALLTELFQQKKRLLEIKATMERDYQRISSRYARIITGINKSLKQRVVELDRPIFDLCERDVTINNNRLGLLSGLVPVCQKESVAISQQIVSSNLKSNSVKVIAATKDFLHQMNEQKIITDQIMLKSIECKDTERYIPVVICSTILDKQGNESMTCSLPDSCSSFETQTISNEVNSAELQWKQGKENPQVTQEFARMVAQSNSSQRVKDLANKMYRSAATQNL